jgi:hypothetical protein
LINYSAADECLENLAGLGEVAYLGLRSDLSAPLTAAGNVYSGLAFKDTKGLVKLDLKENSQKIEGSSNGKRKGYNLTATLVFDAVNRKTSLLSRALNNLGDLFVIMPDGDDIQIMYDPNKKIHADQGGITSTTGDTPDSDRITTAALILGPVKYSNLFLDLPEGKTLDELVIQDA